MKGKTIGIAACLFALLSGCASKPEASTPEQEISVNVIVKDEVNDQELLNETITETGEIKTLYDFLEQADQLDVKFEKGGYGAYIDSMMGLKQDFDKGPWWLYSSDNNTTCQKEGMCPAVEELEIQDGDAFEFTYTKEF